LDAYKEIEKVVFGAHNNFQSRASIMELAVGSWANSYEK